MTASSEQFKKTGYLVVDTGISESTLDQAMEELGPYWGSNHASLAHADASRIQDGWKVSQAVKNISIHPRILDILRELYQKTPMPFQTLNFRMGSEQEVHSDSIHFNSEPFGYMCGVWVALEDIGPDQGPLIYYPESNSLPEINFDDLGVESDYQNYPAYLEHIQQQISALDKPPSFGTIKKGQAIIWSANILHGGSEHRDKNRTRYSQVTHYYFNDCKYWRPGHSAKRHWYFEPDWIPFPGNQRKFVKLRKLRQALVHRVFH